MENSAEKTTLNILKTVSDRVAEQGVDVQINLPEYCTDIKKILKCFVIPNIFAAGISGDRATADGESVVRILYIGESGKLECYEQSVPFSKYIELVNPESDLCVSAAAKTEYVNCRAVSQRRISVSANVCIHFVIKRVEKENLFCGCDGGDIQVRSEVISCTQPIAVCEKMFDMSETAALSDEKPAISAMIKTNTSAVIDTVKTVSDKMLIKGDMITDILYCTDSENGGTEKFRHTMPISQIIDLEGIDENSLCSVNVDICSVCVSAKADSEGKNRLFDISVKAAAYVSAYKNEEVKLVSDGYSTEYETEDEYKNLCLRKHIFTYKETKQIRSSLDVGNLSAKEIVDVFALKCDGGAENSGDGKINGKGELTAGILYINSDDEYGYTEKTLDFPFECKGEDTENRICAEPHFTVTDTSGSLSANGQLEIRSSVLVSMPIFEECEKYVCVKLEAQKDKQKLQSDCPLTVYFSSKGEKIWDIARKYNTTCERIKEDNDITGDEVTDKTMLLISAV